MGSNFVQDIIGRLLPPLFEHQRGSLHTRNVVMPELRHPDNGKQDHRENSSAYPQPGFVCLSLASVYLFLHRLFFYHGKPSEGQQV